MKISELKDPRDRDACERAERGQSIHQARRQDKFWRRVSVPDYVIPNYDDRAEAEFQTGDPKPQRLAWIDSGPPERGSATFFTKRVSYRED